MREITIGILARQCFLRSEQKQRADEEKIINNLAVHCYGSEGKGPQPMAMVAWAMNLHNQISERKTTIATCPPKLKGAKRSTTNFCTTMGLNERPHNGRCFE